MELSDLASIAEIIGLVALVPSLIYVGLQIRKGNRETRAATEALVGQRYLLEPDVDPIVQRAGEHWDWIMQNQ